MDHIALVSDVGRALLIRLSLLVGNLHLVHRTIKLIQAILLHVIIKDSLITPVRANIESHFHLRVAAITHTLIAFLNIADIIRQESRFVQATSLVHAFLSRGVELDHHG